MRRLLASLLVLGALYEHGVVSEPSAEESAPPASVYPTGSTLSSADLCGSWKRRWNRSTPPEQIMEYLGGRTVPDAIPYHGQCTHTGKVFGVGVFKTGTTSLSADLRQLGYIPCGSASGWIGIGHKELFYQNFDGPSLRKSIQASPVLRDFVRALGNATLSATDGPWLFHYQEFDEWFPGSKFVLTVRKDPTELVDSEMGMHLGEGGQHLVASGANVSLSSLLISYAQITEPRKQAKVKQFLQRLLVWGLLTKRRYDQHTAAVRAYFANRPDDLLELCLDCDVPEGGEDPDSALRSFLGCPHHDPGKEFPKKNRVRTGWSHRFFTQEDMEAGVTDWARFPEPEFPPLEFPVYPDLVTPQLKRYKLTLSEPTPAAKTESPAARKRARAVALRAQAARLDAEADSISGEA